MSSNTAVIPTLNPVYAERRARREQSAHQSIWTILDSVYDPELPGLTIWDLGILQDVQPLDDGWRIVITPTYSGCPAVDAISDDIVTAMTEAGYSKVVVKVALAPAWTTDMMSPAGAEQLRSINIAPPSDTDSPQCPVCHSGEVELVSQFGSTACKALYQCKACHEPFDYFKQL